VSRLNFVLQKMSGGDLDGDKFFVCWDAKLIPQRNFAPALHKSQAEMTVPKVTYVRSSG